jgi:hypothetical protein
MVPGAGPAEWAGDLTPISARDWSYERAAHLLERAGFGGTPEEIAALAAMTPEEAVNYLVDYQSIDASSPPAYVPSNTYPLAIVCRNFAASGPDRELASIPARRKLSRSRSSASGSRYGNRDPRDGPRRMVGRVDALTPHH